MYYKLLDECDISYDKATADNPWTRDWKKEILADE